MKIILCLLFVFKLYAGTKEYTVGTGSEFNFTGSRNESVTLSIYITESSFTKLGVEYFFSTNSGFSNIEVWQQYRMGIGPSSLSLENGYVLSSDMKKPEIMTSEFMNNNKDGVNVTDFFFTNEKEIEKYKIGMESIEVPAGSILSTHYRKKRDDQTVDFWISDKAGAIGLVKLVSSGSKNAVHNYKVELSSLLKNVKAKINPLEAVPLTEKGRQFLGKTK